MCSDQKFCILDWYNFVIKKSSKSFLEVIQEIQDTTYVVLIQAILTWSYLFDKNINWVKSFSSGCDSWLIDRVKSWIPLDLKQLEQYSSVYGWPIDFDWLQRIKHLKITPKSQNQLFMGNLIDFLAHAN